MRPGWFPGGRVMLSLRRARGLIRWLSFASPSALLPQEVWIVLVMDKGCDGARDLPCEGWPKHKA